MILNYIASKKAFNKVGGTQLWKKMKKEKVARDRTWRSMQVWFFRTLTKKIEKKTNTWKPKETATADVVQIFLSLLPKGRP